MPTNTYGIPGPTNPKDAYVEGRTSVPSAGGYKGWNITPGTDADIAAQVQRINAMGNTSAAPSPSTNIGAGSTPPVTGTGAGASTNLDAAYSTALNKYLESLNTSNDINEQVDKASLISRRKIEDIYDTPGGLKSGANESAAFFNRRANANLADLGIAQDASTRATQASLERLKFEQSRLPSNEDFNLSAGQVRYSYDPVTGGYKQVASGPEKAAEAWGDPYMLGGDYVQRNSATGEIRTAVNVASGDSTSTAAARAAQQRADINAAINDFRTQMTMRQWAGANPNAYMQYKEYLLREYGLSAVNELDNAMQAFGIAVDTKNK